MNKLILGLTREREESIMAKAYVNGEEVIEVRRKFGDVLEFEYKETGKTGTALACQVILEYDED